MYGKRSGKFIYEAGYTYTSPGLELNDIGFLSQTDQMTQWVWMQYRKLTPFGAFRSMRTNFTQYLDWDFDRTRKAEGYEWDMYLQTKSFWTVSVGATVETKTVSNADLRGGPSLHYPGNFSYAIYIGSDPRKKLSFGINPQFRNGFKNYFSSKGVDVELVYKPVNAFNIALEPSLSYVTNKLQYVDTGDANGEDRHVVGEINQTIARMSLRMTYMITPNLSIQYWGQPFGTSGQYSRFKRIINGDASQYSDRFDNLPPNGITLEDDEYSVDENQDGETDYSFDKPDFNFGQFRSNMVMRWEYIPGSTVFFVWTQEMNGEFFDRENDFHNRYSFRFEDKAHNIFLLKYTYRFVL
jgi:hypothetical protein